MKRVFICDFEITAALIQLMKSLINNIYFFNFVRMSSSLNELICIIFFIQ